MGGHGRLRSSLRVEWATGPDWREERDYVALLGADRSLLAWEWLRRNPLYAAAAQGAPAGKAGAPRDFGLVVFEPPKLAVPDARPVWRSDFHSHVLRFGVRARGGDDDLFDLARMALLARIVRGRSADHLLLSDGFRAIRLDGPPGALRADPVCLSYRIQGLASAERSAATLRRFLTLYRGGRFSRSLQPPEVRARRWVLMLRVFDALTDGVNQRTIAEVLISQSASAPLWRSREPSTRLQIQRLARSARLMAAGGYRDLLR